MQHRRRSLAGGSILAFSFLLVYPLTAGVVVNSTLSLTQLSITPGAGTLQYLPPFTATALADAHDSLGGADSNFDSQDDAVAGATATAFLASANASADAPNKLATAASFINIPDIDASAGSTGQGTLLGFFQITGTTDPVLVQISAILSGNQTLITGPGGSARSEIIFSLILPDIESNPLLFYDNLLEIGPNQSTANSPGQTLSQSVTLQPDTPYFLIAQVDSESSGVNSVPEPSCAFLIATGASLMLLRRRYNSQN